MKIILITPIMMLSPLLIVLSPLLIFVWINLFYVLFHKNKEGHKELSILSITSLYLFSLVPLGIFIGYYLENKTIEVNGLKVKKFSTSIQSNGSLIFLISIVSTIFSLINLK